MSHVRTVALSLLAGLQPFPTFPLLAPQPCDHPGCSIVQRGAGQRVCDAPQRRGMGRIHLHRLLQRAVQASAAMQRRAAAPGGRRALWQ